MKDFAFRLERVLKLRKTQERAALAALGRARRAVREAQEYHKLLCHARNPLDRAWHERVRGGGVDAATMHDFTVYRGVLEQRITAAAQLVQKAAELERSERATMEKVKRKRRVLEKLRARHKARNEMLVLSAEQQAIDEAGSHRCERRRSAQEGERS